MFYVFLYICKELYKKGWTIRTSFVFLFLKILFQLLVDPGSVKYRIGGK